MGTEVQNIVANIDAFNKPLYYKNEILPELLKLQLQISAIAYGEDEESLKGEKPKIYEVVNYLKKRNKDHGNIADRQLIKFEEESNVLCNRIKNEISGRIGEKSLFAEIRSMSYSDKILTNVELDENTGKTELDAVLIMKSGILILEAKNTAKIVSINSKGAAITYGKQSKPHGNIEDKMLRKEQILREALNKAGISDATIRSCIVLTNNKVELGKTKNTRVKVCLLDGLEWYLEELDGLAAIFSEEQMNFAYKAIKNAKCTRPYPFNDFDVQKYKRDFAKLMVMLNESKEREESTLQQSQYVETVQQKSQYWNQEQQPTMQQTQYYDQVQQPMIQQTQYYDQAQQPMLQQSQYGETAQQQQYWSQMQQPMPQYRANKCFDILESAFEAGIEVMPTILKYVGAAAMITVGLSHPVMSFLLKKRLLF